MALGWKGIPGDNITLNNYQYSPQTIQLIKKIQKSTQYASSRDFPTHQTIRSIGIENALMTGCSVWYDLNYLNNPFIPPNKINKIEFTPAQNPLYSDQSIKILRQLKDYYNHSTILSAFHRVKDEATYTDQINAANLNKLSSTCRYL